MKCPGSGKPLSESPDYEQIRKIPGGPVTVECPDCHVQRRITYGTRTIKHHHTS